MRRLLTRKELCEILGISYSTLNRLMNAGVIYPVFGRGRKLMFCPDDVDALIRSRQSSSRSPPSPFVGSPAKQHRKAEAEFAARQNDAKNRLLAHAEGRRSATK